MVLRPKLLIHRAWNVIVEAKTQYEGICIFCCVFGSDHYSLVMGAMLWLDCTSYDSQCLCRLWKDEQ